MEQDCLDVRGAEVWVGNVFMCELGDATQIELGLICGYKMFMMMMERCVDDL